MMNLKYCPFCGRTPQVVEIHKKVVIECNCGIQTVPMMPDEAEEYWNKRIDCDERLAMLREEIVVNLKGEK